MEQNEAPVFGIEKLYVKDLSVEVPGAPTIFLEQEAPKIDVQFSTAANAVDAGIYEVVLTLTVSAKIGDKTAFLVEVGQGGVFRIANVPEDQLEPIIAIACPNLLYPYAREVVSDASTRAGFPPVVLQPVNFEAMYMARQEQQAAAPHEVPVQ